MTGSQMNIIEILQKAFPKQDDSISIIEKYSSFIVEYSVKQPLSIENKLLDDIKKFVPGEDLFTMEVIVENDEPITITSINFDTKSFATKINEANSYLEASENVKFKFSIRKKTSNSIINIYDFTHFLIFCESITVTDWLDVVNKDLSKNKFLKFIVLDNEFDSFWSNNILFSNSNIELNYVNEVKINDNCHFGNYEQFPYDPSYFHLVKRPEFCNRITDILDRLAYAFSVISIFDITTIDNNKLSYKLNGYKTIQDNFDIENVDIESKDIYMKIYNWVYAEKANSADKIGLTRNIISIYAKENLPKIDETAYFSIQSGFKTYLQENLNKYIEIRNKISDQLFEISDRSIRVAENYLSYYQKCNITFVTFFISVFTIRAITTKNFNDIFSKETTLISLTLIAVSFGYMIVSLLGLNSEIRRINQKYLNIKNRFKDLLIEEDINKILRDDHEFKDDISYIKKRRLLYSILWTVTILLFTITTCYLSSYVCEIVKNIINHQQSV